MMTTEQVEQMQLWKTKRRLQQGFWQFFFNLSDVSAGTCLTAEKFFGRTLYAQRKCCLWKTGGKHLPTTHHEARRSPGTPGEPPLTAGIGWIQQGHFVKGKWVVDMWLNGDQDHQGRHLRLPAEKYDIQRIKLYRYR